MQAERDAAKKGKSRRAVDGAAGDEVATAEPEVVAERREALERRGGKKDRAGSGEPGGREDKLTPAGTGGAPFAVLGYFLTPKELYHACEALRDAGYEHFDAHTPFPVHGLERAMGIPPSRLPWYVLGGGVTGLVGGILLAWYTQGVSYPLDISGKPPLAFSAYVPVLFELTVLFAGLTCFFGLWGIMRLPTFFHPTMTHPSFPRATDDAFFISVEARDPKFDRSETRSLLEKLGAKEIAEVAP